MKKFVVLIPVLMLFLFQNLASAQSIKEKKLLCMEEPLSGFEQSLNRIALLATYQRDNALKTAKEFEQGYKFNRNINWASRGLTAAGTAGAAIFGVAAGTAVGFAGVIAATESSAIAVGSVHNNMAEWRHKPLFDKSTPVPSKDKGKSIQLLEISSETVSEVVLSVANSSGSEKAHEELRQKYQKIVETSLATFLEAENFIGKSFAAGRAEVDGGTEGKLSKFTAWTRSPFGGDAKKFWKLHFEEQLALAEVAKAKLDWVNINLKQVQEACTARAPKTEALIEEGAAPSGSSSH